MAKFSEDQFEQAIVELFQDNGYVHVNGDMLHRKFDEVLLEDDMKNFLTRRYPDITNTELEKIINKIKYVPNTPLYMGNREAFYLVNEGLNLQRDDSSKGALHIEYIDFETPENNIFKVVTQFTVRNIQERRPDMLIFINGIPVVIFEFKSAINENTTIHDAWKQINIRYNRDIPSLMKYTFLSVISDGANTKLGSIFTQYEYYYSWNKIDDDVNVPDASGIKSLFTMIYGAFAKSRLINILRDFIYYPDSDKKETPIVTRYPQFFAAIKMLENIKQHLKPLGDGKGGTYFGATGSGKTNTMLILTRLLGTHYRDVFQSPTVIILVDREDLSNQTSKLFEESKRYLKTENVKTISSRAELKKELSINESGGVYITTIQKFEEATGLLSERNNIICISDEAHRTQTNTGAKLKYTDAGVETSYGFAKYLRDSFPNATYAGFTGTPIDDTIHVFGQVIESYTMKESAEDGITVRISYEPRLARVIINPEQVAEIDSYYKEAENQDANTEQIEASKRTMSKVTQILNHPDRIRKVAGDIVEHFEKVVNTKPKIVQKAMIVCLNREHAFKVYQELAKIRPDWFVAKKTDRNDLSKQELEKLEALPKVNIVATRNKDDELEMYNLLGDSNHRKILDTQFKNNNSNFQIAIVVDMWITGFDVPSLAVMYIDKPLQKHTLIQTISRVNRVFEGKDRGLIVDYIGIKRAMLEAVKKYGNDQDGLIETLDATLKIFRNQLSIINDLLTNFDGTDFYKGSPVERLLCLNRGAEYVQRSDEMEKRFMYHSRRMKLAYEIVYPSGELSDDEAETAQFYLAVRSIIYKQTKGTSPDTETMNKHVQTMVENAIASTGVEDIINNDKLDLFDEGFIDELNQLGMPITKYNALLKLLGRAIDQYGRTNKVKAIEFSKRLEKVVDAYNNRDKQIFVSAVTSDFIDSLSDEIMNILKDLRDDMESFKKLGITYEEKVFYDILIKVRDDHDFEYEDKKCIELAKAIKELVDDKSQYADWASREDIKSQLNMDLTILLYENGYPPQWNDEVFEQVLGQAENFKKSF